PVHVNCPPIRSNRNGHQPFPKSSHRSSIWPPAPEKCRSACRSPGSARWQPSPRYRMRHVSTDRESAHRQLTEHELTEQKLKDQEAKEQESSCLDACPAA